MSGIIIEARQHVHGIKRPVSMTTDVAIMISAFGVSGFAVDVACAGNTFLRVSLAFGTAPGSGDPAGTRNDMMRWATAERLADLNRRRSSSSWTIRTRMCRYMCGRCNPSHADVMSRFRFRTSRARVGPMVAAHIFSSQLVITTHHAPHTTAVSLRLDTKPFPLRWGTGGVSRP